MKKIDELKRKFYWKVCNIFFYTFIWNNICGLAKSLGLDDPDFVEDEKKFETYLFKNHRFYYYYEKWANIWCNFITYKFIWPIDRKYYVIDLNDYDEIEDLPF